MAKYHAGYSEDADLKEMLFSDLYYNQVTGELYWVKQTRKRVLGKPVGTPHSSGYLLFSTGINGKIYSLRVHRVCWLLAYGEWPVGFVDHKNRDRSDNRLENLRLASNQENAQNTALPVTNKSGFRGVSWSEYHKKWVARIGIGNQKHKFVGYFNCPTAAAFAYDKASLEYHKDYGVRNFL